MKSTEKLLSITHLKQYFPVKKKALFGGRRYVRANEDITIDIYRGEILGLVGESGCGKSTLGRTILQLYRPTAGRVMYYGRSLEELAPAYVTATLRHAARAIARYRKKESRVIRLARKCETAGERATFEQLQRLALLRAEAETQRRRLSSLLGGLCCRMRPRKAPRFYCNALNIGYASGGWRGKTSNKSKRYTPVLARWSASWRCCASGIDKTRRLPGMRRNETRALISPSCPGAKCEG